MKITDPYSFNEIEVNRNNIFGDAFNGIMNKSSQELKKRLTIIFKEEEGIDAGGLLRYILLFFFISIFFFL